jgi:regulator of protease activity HflC (stomatin/prohibitin superfamily)
MKTFGIVDDKILQPGLHIKNPVTEVIPISTRTLKYMDYGKSDVATITALSNDGLTTTMGVAITYHVNPKKVQDLYKTVGTDYEGVIMVNPIHSVPRDMISKYDTKTLYSASKEGSSDRAKLERELFSTIQDRINEIGVTDSIIIEQASIRNIDFDQKYKDSISTKMETDTAIQTKVKEVAIAEAEAKKAVATAEGEANAMRVRAQGRADAARIEAAGTKDAMRTIGEDNYAAILFIQTMKDNPRAIYLPNDGSIPIIKNVDATASA